MANATSKIRLISHTAMYLALAILLPVAFHALGAGGRVFLPMHIPVLLAGFLIGPAGGLAVGLLAPALSNLLTGMPPTYAVVLMSTELPMYGLVAGITYSQLRLNIYVSLIIAMVVGRIMFGLSLFVLGLFIDLPYSAATFFSTGGAIVAGLPGIALQIIIIPVIVSVIKRRRRA
ncbi:MAG TPA: ECF transporter S component [Candidatus Deferrimicrobium sp.]|nr:ECF transporter S component [Candidatus Deferrimicrobium sp.]